MNPNDIMQDYWWEIRKYRQSKQTDEDLEELLAFIANVAYAEGMEEERSYYD